MRLSSQLPTPVLAPGSCPHGQPMGMCPSCGGGGGGGSKLRPGEMSWGEGAALWAAFKANKLRQQDQQAFFAFRMASQKAESASPGVIVTFSPVFESIVRVANWVQTLLLGKADGRPMGGNGQAGLAAQALKNQILDRLQKLLPNPEALTSYWAEKDKLLKERLASALQRIRRWVVEESWFGQGLTLWAGLGASLQTRLRDVGDLLQKALPQWRQWFRQIKP